MRSSIVAHLPKFCWKRYKFTILLGSTVVLILWLMTNVKNIVNINNGAYSGDPVPVRRYFWESKDEDATHLPIPTDWLQWSKCPACFGTEMCSAVEREEVMLSVTEAKVNPDLPFAFGKYGGEDIVVKRLGTNKYSDIYDKYICGNSTGCDVAKRAVTSPISSQDSLTIAALQNAYTIVTKKQGYLTNNLCLTPKLLKEIKSLYTHTRDTGISREERATLYTSIVINYEAALGKYFTNYHAGKWKFPQYYGACGRVVIAENGGVLLERYLEAPWDMRAAIGLQLLKMVDDFVDKDPDWMIFYPDVRFPNFAVNREGYVQAIDLNNIMIIDKKDVASYAPEKAPQVCNKECFIDLTKGFMKDTSERPKQCARVSVLAKDIMYAHVCQKIFSDLDEHKGFRMFDEDTGKRQQRGLLRSPPGGTEYIEGLLKECVTESGPGQRHEAVEKIKKFLQANVKPVIRD